jgi:hypothetical protein
VCAVGERRREPGAGATPSTLEGMSVEPVSGAAGTALMGDISTLMSQLRAEGTGGLNNDKGAVTG